MSFADDFYDGAQPNNGRPQAASKSSKKKQAQLYSNAYDYEAQNPSEDLEYPQDGLSPQAKSIASDISDVLNLIENQENKLDKIIKKLGTKAETKELRQELTTTIENISKQIKKANDSLHTLQALATKEKGEAEKRSKELETTFKARVERFKKQAGQCQHKETQSIKEEKKAVSHMKTQQTGSSNGNKYDEDEQTSLMQSQKMKPRVADYAQEIEHNEMIIAEREEDIRDIAKSIHEIHDVFRELNVMINEQGEQLDLIENNVEDAALNVHTGVQDLKTANKLDKKGRNLTCIILIVVLVLGVAITIGLLITLKVLNIIKF